MNFLKRRWKKILLVLSVLLILGYMGFSLYSAVVLTSSFGRHIEISPELINKNYENISFKTSDNLTLRGWLFRNTSDKLIIFVHGMRGNRHDTGYYMVNIAQELTAQGYNILTFDQRAHGESDGDHFGYGANEWKDVVAAVDFAKSKGFAPAKTAIIANSTGAVSTLGAIDKIADIGAFVLDSAAGDFRLVVEDRLWQEAHVPSIFYPTIFFFSKYLFGVDFYNDHPIDKLKLVPQLRFLYLSCIHDETTKPAEAQQLLAASNPGSKLVSFPKGGHIETYKKNPDLYRTEVFGWLNQELGN